MVKAMITQWSVRSTLWTWQAAKDKSWLRPLATGFVLVCPYLLS